MYLYVLFALTYVLIRAIIIIETRKEHSTVKTSEFTKKAKDAGCYIVEHGKEHDKWYSPITGKYFRVPRHQSKELGTGLADRMMKDAGLK